jgi:Cullin family
MDKVMGLFKLMTNIDKFEEHYRRTLSRRLLADKSNNSDIEKNVVTRFKVPSMQEKPTFACEF